MKTLEQYIRDAAVKRGIDPDVAVRVARSEGGLKNPVRQSDFRKGGVREPSYGPFQMLVGGKGTGFPKGLGNSFIEQTGLDPRNPSHARAAIDYALDHAAKHGWGAWYGAARVGIGKREGIGKNKSFAGSPFAALSKVPIPTARPLDVPADLAFSYPAPLSGVPRIGVERGTLPAIPSSLPAAPVGPVERSAIPGVPVSLSGVPTMAVDKSALSDAKPATNIANAYGQLADTMGQVGVMGLSGSKQFDPLQGYISHQNLGTVKALQAVPQASVVKATLPEVPTQIAPPIAAPKVQAGPSIQAPVVAPQMARASDVWGGRASIGRATNGDTIAANPDGSFTRTSAKYGYTQRVGPDGSSIGGAKYGATPSITGFLSGRNNSQRSGSLFGGVNAAALAGRVGGSVLGGLIGGPIGAFAGGQIGSRLAGGNRVNSFPSAPSPANTRSKDKDKAGPSTLAEALGWGGRSGKGSGKSAPGGGLY